MTVFAGLAIVLVVVTVALGVECARSRSHGRALVAVQLAGPVGTMLLLLVGLTVRRSIFYELPLVWALMSFVGVVAFLRLRGNEL